MFALTGSLAVLFTAHGIFWIGAGVVDTSLPAVIREKLTNLGDCDETVGLANGVAMTCKSFSLVCSPLLANWLFAEYPLAVYLQGICACSLSVMFAFLAKFSLIS
jgi:hypothetical protein